ncbi:MAG: LysM peptidoglycan-binding domain-containing protein, partial [Clostridiales bacterium]|nr:LysM peptidoglycan-binding domain-containing protein [Clostridiales bacterium]
LSEGSIYKVKAGDTLSNIVIENMPGIDYNLALKIIVEDNDIKNYTIYPNQELFIASID